MGHVEWIWIEKERENIPTTVDYTHRQKQKEEEITSVYFFARKMADRKKKRKSWGRKFVKQKQRSI